MARTAQEVVFVDGVRTPFGRAGNAFAETRADDLVVKVFRELLRRNPNLPPSWTMSAIETPHRSTVFEELLIALALEEPP